MLSIKKREKNIFGPQLKNQKRIHIVVIFYLYIFV